MEYLNAYEHTETAENYNGSSKTRTFYKWTKESLEKMLHSRHLQEFDEHLDHDNISEAIQAFNNLIQDSCEMKSNRRKKVKISSSEWWDSEMACLTYNKYKALKMLRLECNESALVKYRNIRKLCKSKIKEKKENLKQSLRCAVESCSSASEFWKFVKSRYRSKQCVNHISIDEWKLYFDQLLNSESVVDDEFKANIEEYMSCHDGNCNVCNSEMSPEDILNSDISINEVESTVKQLHNGKSPGLDGISNGLIKNASVVIVPLMCLLFNKILQSGSFPTSWGRSLIVPLYKKGSVNDPSNYTSFALLSCVSKVFTKILNNRLTNWAKDNDKMYEVQGGFTKGNSTIDQIFVFQSLVSEYVYI